MGGVIDPEHKQLHQVNQQELNLYFKARRESIKAVCGKVWSPLFPSLKPVEVRTYCEICREAYVRGTTFTS